MSCLFYSPKEMKVFVTTNTRFLYEDYVNNYRLKSKAVLDEMLDARETTSSEVPEDEVVVLDTINAHTLSSQDSWVKNNFIQSVRLEILMSKILIKC
jgi:hypothetical protein